MTWFRWIITLLITGLIVVATMGSLKPRPERPVSVQVTKASKTTITRHVTGAGKLEPMRKVNVSSNITGILTDLQVGMGSEVKKGQFLGQIDTSRYLAEVARQRAQLEAALAEVNREQAGLDRLKGELERSEKLFEQKIVQLGEVEQARSQVKAAEAQIDSAKSRVQVVRASLGDAQNSVDWGTLRSPVDGTVLAVNHRVGERIRGSDFSEDVVLVLGSLSQMDVRIEVGEHDVVFVRPGQAAKIEIDALPELVIPGKVIDNGRDAIIRNAGTESEVTSFPVWIAIDKPPPSALSGMSAQVTIETETHADVVAVPIQAVTVRPEGQEKKDGGPPRRGARMDKVVFVVTDKTAHKRKVTVGLSSESMIEVTSGLSEGEQVVEGPYRTLARELKDGTHVEF
ncbi:MAG: efflux RND transporter periplasmic adaptor subunit [Deltaproteobacteria bacterium]|nr:efflux RND transporter periplasmic adaptor subunit [Deltaproteobacteria bacterium]